MSQDGNYGSLNKVSIDAADAGLDLDVTGEMSLKLKRTDGESLGTDPDEVEDLFLVFHYEVDDLA